MITTPPSRDGTNSTQSLATTLPSTLTNNTSNNNNNNNNNNRNIDISTNNNNNPIKSMPESDKASPYITLISGTIAGTTATIAKQPLERLKWLRQVARMHSELGSGTNYFKLGQRIIKEEGFLGPFRGTYGGITRNVPHAALIYTVFPKVRMQLIQYNPSWEENKSLLNTMTGAISSVACTLITHPLDTVRVRYAIQFQNIQHLSYTSLLSTILKEGGFIGFYRGIITTCFGAVFRGGVGFGVYETLKSKNTRNWTATHPIMDRMSIGMLAGITSTVASYPIDTVRRRMQVWGSRGQLTEAEIKIYGDHMTRDVTRSGIKLVSHILKHDGIVGLYRGLGITMIKTPIATAVSLTINDIVKKYFGFNA